MAVVGAATLTCVAFMNGAKLNAEERKRIVNDLQWHAAADGIIFIAQECRSEYLTSSFEYNTAVFCIEEGLPALRKLQAAVHKQYGH